MSLFASRVGRQVEVSLREVDLSPAAAPSSILLPASHGLGLAFTLLLQVGPHSRVAGNADPSYVDPGQTFPFFRFWFRKILLNKQIIICLLLLKLIN